MHDVVVVLVVDGGGEKATDGDMFISGDMATAANSKTVQGSDGILICVD